MTGRPAVGKRGRRAVGSSLLEGQVDLGDSSFVAARPLVVAPRVTDGEGKSPSLELA